MYLSKHSAWDHVRAEFQRIWGYDDFRAPQGEIIRSLLLQQDALVVMPTGGGKSICFQLPALIRTGLTLVVSPLVALMENQVQDLKQRHLPAALLHSELSKHERYQTLKAIERQQLRLLYVSPETLLSDPVWEKIVQPQLRINGLILDEAHCLVQWGETFRPAYRRLGAVRSALVKAKPHFGRIAIAAFTATADPTAQSVIASSLQLTQPDTFLINPYRPNLQLSVQTVWTPRGRRQQLLRFIRKQKSQSGLVYVRTRHDSESLAAWLQQEGFPTAAYHGGLNPVERRAIESSWLGDRLQFVVCTSAFGMGINKPNVRWVIHFHAPMLLSEYVQEVGRAGRDGKPAEALTLVSEPTGWLDPDDRQRAQFFTEQMRSQRKVAQQLVRQIPRQGCVKTVTQQHKHGAIALALLNSNGQLTWEDPFHYTIQSATAPRRQSDLNGSQQMMDYLTTRTCRWQYLLQAFGFVADARGLHCGHCDRCLSARD